MRFNSCFGMFIVLTTTLIHSLSIADCVRTKEDELWVKYQPLSNCQEAVSLAEVGAANGNLIWKGEFHIQAYRTSLVLVTAVDTCKNETSIISKAAKQQYSTLSFLLDPNDIQVAEGTVWSFEQANQNWKDASVRCQQSLDAMTQQ